MTNYSCLKCCCKHVARAFGFMSQWGSGYYPQDKWLVIGELSHAEDHVINIDPDLHWSIVAARKKVEENLIVDLYPLLVELDKKISN